MPVHTFDQVPATTVLHVFVGPRVKLFLDQRV
jgi:hypothetical protein